MFELALITLAVVASIGPTNLFAIKEGLRHGARITFYVILGGVFVDLFYANLAGAGLAVIGENFYFKVTLLSIGSLFLAYIGIKGLYTALRKNLPAEATATRKLHPLLIGILMTLPNPFTIIFWTTALTGLSIGYQPLLLLVVILSVGALWAALEAFVIHFFRKVINEKSLKIVEALAASIILGFAIKFSLQLIALI